MTDWALQDNSTNPRYQSVKIHKVVRDQRGWESAKRFIINLYQANILVGFFCWSDQLMCRVLRKPVGLLHCPLNSPRKYWFIQSTPRYLLWQISDQSEIPRVFSNYSNCTNTITKRSLRGYLQQRTDRCRTAAMMMETKSPDTVRSFTITYTPRACKTGGILGKCQNYIHVGSIGWLSYMIFKHDIFGVFTPNLSNRN